MSIMSNPLPQPRIPSWTFGDRVRKVRRELGMSQAGFAVAIGHGEKALASWEAGSARPNDVVEIAKKIADISDFDAGWIAGLYDGTPPGGAGPITPAGSSAGKSARTAPLTLVDLRPISRPFSLVGQGQAKHRSRSVAA